VPIPRALLFDIETIGDVTEANHDAIAGFAHKAERSAQEFAALCPPLARVVCIGLYDLASDRLDVIYDSNLGNGADRQEAHVPEQGRSESHVCRFEKANGEADLLGQFAQRVTAHFETPDAHLVSFNGNGFDLPVLIHRSVRHGVHLLRHTLSPALQAGSLRHIDLMEVFTFEGRVRRYPLALYSTAFGFASSKQNMDGPAVAPAVADGRILDVAQYCAADVIATTELYRRWFGIPVNPAV